MLGCHSSFFVLWACREEAPQPVERIRAIKTYTVKERASGRIRRFSGVVEAADSSSISFEVSGNVQEVRVNVGDKITKGQVLAVLDKRTYNLSVKSAEADLGKAKVQLADKRKDLDRLQRIAKQDPGAISQASLDQAKAAYDSARKNVDYATSQLNLAKRDLRKTVLRAPYNGVIAKRYVDPFNEVNRGQRLFDIYMEGGMEVAINIPETEIKGIYLDLKSEIRFPTDPGNILRGVVTEISSVASIANAFPVKVTILDPSKQIRPGMTAEVTLLLKGKGEESTFLVPLVAIVPGDDPTRGYVFVYDPNTSTVKKTPVSGTGVVRENSLVVAKGVKEGDIIAAAGVSFLEDGQKVKLMEK
ncbi:MAG: efflux RND transporter periplasmic adaptor subunit [Planctomycetota bacterium]